MKHNTVTLIIICLLIPKLVMSQNFADGFAYLNNGAYDKAETFFTSALQEYPDNKTAKICYGRAIGLNGNPMAAKQTFLALVNQNPTDKESLLNLAESYLWNNEPKEAITLYENVNSQYPREQLILKSLANAHALDLQYDIAFNYASDCLNVDPNDKNSKETFRSIGLAYAHSLKTDKQYSKSRIILEQLDQLYPDNLDIITSKAYNLLADKKYESARLEFQKLQDLDLDPIKSLIGLASISLQTGKYKQSLSFLHNDLLHDSKLSKAQKIEKWDVSFGNYLASNPGKAKEVLANLKQYLSPSQFAEKQVYLQLELENFDDLENYINQISNKSSKQNIELRVALESNQYKTFDTLLENIDYQIADSYTEILIQSIKSRQAHKFISRIELAQDNGKNLARELDLYFEAAEAQLFSPFIRIKSRWLSNTEQNINTSNHTILTIGSRMIIKDNGTLKFGFGVESISNVEKSKTFIPSYDISFRYQLNKRHFTRLFSFKKQLNYNQNLFRQNINKYNIGLEHHFVTRSAIGSYSQLNFIMLTDTNKGYDMFNSLYINIKNNPIIQTGINSTFLSYNENKVEYFSPKSLVSISPFFKLSNEYSPNTSFKYSLLSSVGQQIDLQNSIANQLVYSVQLKAGYHLNQHMYSELFYTYANNSSALNNGFSSYYLGLNLNYSL